MIRLSGSSMIIVGFVLVLSGAILPWLIKLRVLPSTWALLFFSFAASTAGVLLGIAGTAYYVRTHRK
jgi:hypothetical protein